MNPIQKQQTNQIKPKFPLNLKKQNKPIEKKQYPLKNYSLAVLIAVLFGIITIFLLYLISNLWVGIIFFLISIGLFGFILFKFFVKK
jgi:hypothetical protein